MKFSYLASWLLFGLLLISSCKKDDEESTFQFDKYPRIKSIQNTHDWNIKNYEYDSKGRMSKFVYGNLISFVSYSDSRVIFSNWMDSIYYLNSDGRVDSTIEGYKFEYDENGYLIRESYDTFDYFIYTILNGNISTEKHIDGSDTDYYFYEYFQKNNTIGYQNQGMSYWGKQNINLISREIRILDADYRDTIYYTYEFDSKDRVVKQIKNRSGHDDGKIYYTYY